MPGNIIYANAKLEKNNIEMFRYESSKGGHKYFNAQGRKY